MGNIVCRLCGRGGFSLLNSHLKFIHGLTVFEYSGKFPGAETCEDEVRSQISRTVRATMSTISDELSKAQTKRFENQEERQRVSDRSKAQWAGYSEEEKKEYLNNSIHSEESREKFRQMHANMTEEEKKEWVDRSFHSESSRRLALERMPDGVRRWWASLSPEEKSEEVFKRVSASAKVNAVGISEPEWFLNLHLEDRFPGEWMYNGDGSQGVVIGGKIPDFVNINGKKEVIEVFGTYWHGEDEVEQKIAHYKKYGFKCIVLWDYECYFVKDVEEKLGVVKGKPDGKKQWGI